MADLSSAETEINRHGIIRLARRDPDGQAKRAASRLQFHARRRLRAIAVWAVAGLTKAALSQVSFVTGFASS